MADTGALSFVLSSFYRVRYDDQMEMVSYMK